MVNSQFFRAPKIPKVKIGRKTIKSAVITGAAVQPQIQLKKSTFSFIKPISNLLQPEKLVSSASNIEKETIIKKIIEPIINNKVSEKIIKVFENKNILQGIGKKPQGIEETLGETNKILAEIQKQLSLDFSSRIDEDKRAIKSDKLRISKEKVALKEKVIEGTKKLGDGIGKVFDKVLAPAKSIFQKILDFFSTIATGIIVNQSFKWLAKEENRQKVYKFITFLGDHWKEILLIVGTAKLLGLILKIVKVAKIFKGLLDLIKKNPPKPPGAGGGGAPCNPLLQCMGNPAFSASFVSASIAALIANQALSSHIRDVAQGLVPTTPTVPAVPPILGPAGEPILFPSNLPYYEPEFTPEETTTSTPTTRSQNQKPWWQQGAPPVWLTDLIKQKKPEASGQELIQLGMMAMQLVAAGISISQAVAQVAVATSNSKGGTILPPKQDSLNLVAGLKVQQENSLLNSAPKKKCDACSLLPFFSSGGTVGGKGSGTVDSVPAMLAPGEEVIKTNSANLFRPLLKDINDNAGRLWESFTKAIVKQENTNTSQAENNNRFSEILNDYQKILKAEERRLKQKYMESVAKTIPGSPRPSTTPSPNPTSPPPSTPPGATQPPPSTPPGGTQPSPPASPMPDASKPGAPGIPGRTDVPRVGDQVGQSPSPPSQPLSAQVSPAGVSAGAAALELPKSNQSYNEPSSTLQQVAAAPPAEPVTNITSEKSLQQIKNIVNFDTKSPSLLPSSVNQFLTIQQKRPPSNLRRDRRPIVATLPVQSAVIPSNVNVGGVTLPEAPSAYVPDISPVNPLQYEEILHNMINLGVITT